MSRIFISHSSRDTEYARDIQELLSSDGFGSVFLDFDPEHGIPVGRHWEQELYSQLRLCHALIILCSRHSMQSPWCFAEVTHAKALGKPIFPLKIADCDINTILTAHQVLDLTADRDGARTRLLRGLHVAGLNPSEEFGWDGTRPPYPGLMAFQYEDAAIFYGRDPEIQQGLELMNRLRQFGGPRLVLAVGASGSGKSSLVRAGIAPRLSRDDRRWLMVPPFRPGPQPLRNLSMSIARAFQIHGRRINGDELFEAVRNAGGDFDKAAAILIHTFEQIRVAADRPDATFVLVVDQAEELLGVDSAIDSRDFLMLLNASLNVHETPLMAIMTLRSDFLPALQAHPAVTSLAAEHLQVGRMSGERLRKVIAGPANLAGLRLEEGLVEAVVDDAENENALPLLAFALRELYETYRENNALRVDDYRVKLGGLAGSVARAAEAVYAAKPLSERDAEELRRAFRRIVRINDQGQYVRQTAPWHGFHVGVHDVLERLVQARLLVADEQNQGRTLEVAHEALFRSWDRLRRWLDEDREFLLWRQRLRFAVDEWQRRREDTGILLRGNPLSEARQWMEHRADELSANERAFIDNSAALERAEQLARQRSSRRLTVTSIAAALVFLSAAIFTGRQWYKSNQALHLIQKKLGRIEVVDDGPGRIAWKIYPRPNGQEDETIDQWNVMTDAGGHIAVDRAGSAPTEISEGDYWLVLSRDDGGRPQVLPIRGHGYNEYERPLRISTASYPAYQQLSKGMHLVPGDTVFVLNPDDVDHGNDRGRRMSFVLKPFFVDDDVVSLESFVAFSNATGWQMVNRNQLYLNWYDAHAYCTWQRKRLMTVVEALQVARTKPSIKEYPNAVRSSGPAVTELVWDYQGDWSRNDITGPPPFPDYKMKKNFDFLHPDDLEPDDRRIEFGYSKGFVAPITRNEQFRFRCAWSDSDSEYARARQLTPAP